MVSSASKVFYYRYACFQFLVDTNCLPLESHPMVSVPKARPTDGVCERILTLEARAPGAHYNKPKVLHIM